MAKNNLFPFYKMSGGGNDFVLFDNRNKVLPGDYGKIAAQVCERKFSIGADGLLVLENEPGVDFRMVYYNSDGSRAEMCGNGARCIGRFAYLLGAAQKKMRFLTDAGELQAQILGDTVKLKMSEPRDWRQAIAVQLEDDRELHLDFINTGVPHAVLMVTDIERVNVAELGGKIRYHKEFAPAGTNANFVFKNGENSLVVRTYERGVEGETLACGTGVVASSLISALQGLVSSPVACLTRGGDTMFVHFEKKGETFQNVYLEGPAEVTFKGEVDLSNV